MYSLAHARVNSQAKAFMSAWTAVIPNSFGMFLIVMQWISHCAQWQIDSVGVFVWALARFVVFVLFLLFASLFPLAKRKSGWGICGSSFLVWLWFSSLLLQSICRLQGPFVLAQCISSLFSCKDRAFCATSATLEEKKALAFLFLSWSTAMSFANLLLWLWHTGLLSLQKLRS